MIDLPLGRQLFLETKPVQPEYGSFAAGSAIHDDMITGREGGAGELSRTMNGKKIREMVRLRSRIRP